MLQHTYIGRNLLDLVFPNICVVCTRALVRGENILCTQCNYELPRTHFSTHENNPVHQLFWGRILLNHASAYFHYRKGSSFQKLLHQLKYHGKYEIGVELGRQFGYELLISPHYHTVELIVPVPLHPKKEKERGYNQSLAIAEGISQALKVPTETIIERKIYAETQTKKSRIDRWQNVEEAFHLKHPEKAEGKHLLLVDDVITTGATLEACALSLRNLNDYQLSIAGLAAA